MEKQEALEQLANDLSAAELATLQRDFSAIQARAAGATWSEIGSTLGVTKQRAQQRYSGDSRERIQRLARAAQEGREDAAKWLDSLRNRAGK